MGLLTSDLRLWISDFGLRMSDFGHRTSGVDAPSRKSEGLKPFRGQICANCEFAIFKSAMVLYRVSIAG